MSSAVMLQCSRVLKNAERLENDVSLCTVTTLQCSRVLKNAERVLVDVEADTYNLQGFNAAAF